MKLFLRNYLLLILLSLLTLFSCVEESTTDSNNPPSTSPTLSIDYGISGNFYIALTNTVLELIQKKNFSSQSNFSVSPTLPNGLSLDVTNGNISGTPTNSSLPVPYTITATADSKTYTNIISLGVAPSPVWVTDTNASKPYELTAYVLGDGSKQISDWTWSSSDPSLATVNNGIVSLLSTPTGGTVVISASKNTSTNSVQSTYSNGISFIVPSASLDYALSGNLYIALTNTNVLLEQKTDLGSQANFSVSPTLPNGLSLNVTNGNISGTPTTASLPIPYTITAIANSKTYPKIISLGVAPSPVWVTNTNPSKPYELTAYVPGDGAKQISDWVWSSSDPSLATVNNGIVSLLSTPTGGTVVISASKNTSTNSVQSTYSNGISFIISSASLDYALSGNLYIALTNTNVLLEQKTDFGSQADFSVSPTLPNGLSLNVTNGNISGTPTNSSLPIPYTITANANGKNYVKILSLGVAPSEVWVTDTNPSKPYELTAYVPGDGSKQISDWTWSSSDTSFATVTNGVVSFLPTPTGRTVVISATKNGNTGTIALDVPVTSINYGISGDFYIALNNTNLLLQQKTDLSSQANFSVNPILPSGLTLNITNGNISGTPTTASLPTPYTITANANGKNYIKMLSLGVAPSEVWVTNANASKPYELTAYVPGDGSKQISDWAWSSSDASLATVNDGIVSLLSTPTGGTVVISASKNSYSNGISFIVPSTSLDYALSGNLYIALMNTNILLEQKTDLGSQANFSVSPTLPNGLSLNVTNGNISGTPTTASLPTPYTITANANGKNYIKMLSLGVAPSPVWVTNTNASKPYELTAYVPGDGSKQISDWTWSSSDESLATVSDGVVSPKYTPTGVTIVISATKNGNTGTITLNVPVASINYGIIGDFYIALNNTNLLLQQKNDLSSQANFSVNPILPSGLTLNATSGNISGIPTTASLPTLYTITANVNGKNYIKMLSLGVAPSPVWVTNTNASKPYELTAYVPGDSAKQISDWVWSSSDASLATVNNGIVNFLSTSTGGTVVISASKNSYSNGVSFTVDEVEDVNGGKIIATGSNVHLIINSGTKVLTTSQFQNKSLTSVLIPNSVTNIESWVFQNNPLVSVVIPNSVTYIGSWAFQNNQLTSVVIPNSVTNIDSWAFQNNQLTHLFIPDSVTTINDNAFISNPNLGEVSLKQSLYTKITNTSSTNAIFGSQVTNYIKRP